MKYEYKYVNFGQTKTVVVEANSVVGADKKIKKMIAAGTASPDVWQRHISTTEIK